MLGPPKTEASYRESLADGLLLFQLKKQISFRKQAMFAMQGEYRSETNLLIWRGDGNPLSKSTIHRAFKAVLKKAEVERNITMHGLRHPQADYDTQVRSYIERRSGEAGHSSIKVSSDMYSHITEKIEKRSIENFMTYLNQ